MKYELQFTIESVLSIEKHDIVGAIYGELEGLLPENLNLRRLSKYKKLGHLLLTKEFKDGKYIVNFTLPSNLSPIETATVASAIETIKFIGSSKVSISLKEIVDLQREKKDYIFSRTKQLLDKLNQTQLSYKEMSLRQQEGKIKFVEDSHILLGPDLEKEKSVYLVEGRRDLLNLFSMGLYNCMSVGGAFLDSKIAPFIQGKEVTCLFDSDRGGKLLVKKLIDLKIPLDFVITLPDGISVEDVNQKTLLKYLNKKQKIQDYLQENDSSET